jgi:DivIVA domain-containing protein
MVQLLLLTIGALVVGAIGFGVAALISGSDPGLRPVPPEGGARALPGNRPLVESDFEEARFDTALRGYRMAQVDTALRRAAYDVGYKLELIAVLEAEVSALREGRTDEADSLRGAREAALSAIDKAGPVVVSADSPDVAGIAVQPAAAHAEPAGTPSAGTPGRVPAGSTGDAAPTVVDIGGVDGTNGARPGLTGEAGDPPGRPQEIQRPEEMRLP